MINLRLVGIAILLFCTGSALMVFELLGTRILIPYIGGTSTVWSITIGTILTAIALGYHIGGMLADISQSARVLAALLMAAALSTILVLPLKTLLAPLLLTGTPATYGFYALCVSLILFLLPGALCASVTTYALRYATQSLHSIGNTHGILYAISTLGSLAGIFGTSFYLVPHYPTSDIIKAIAAVLAFLALCAWIAEHFIKNTPR